MLGSDSVAAGNCAAIMMFGLDGESEWPLAQSSNTVLLQLE